MNIEKINEYGTRNAEILEQQGIKNPMLAKKGTIVVTDLASAVVFEDDGMAVGLEKTLTKGASVHGMMTRAFGLKGADVSSFITTVGNLQEWLRKDTDPCAFCQGADLCTYFLQPGGESDENTNMEIEDASDLHYGWVGVVPINRARLDELLSFMEAEADTKIILTSVMNHEQDSMMSLKTGDKFPYYGAVWVQGPNWEVLLAAVADKVEAAPKFQLGGKFTLPTMKKSGTKAVDKKTPAPTPKKAAPKQEVKKAAPKAAPAKPAAKKPVGKTTVVTKKAVVVNTKGMSLLDRARAKKAQGRKK